MSKVLTDGGEAMSVGVIIIGTSVVTFCELGAS